MILKGSGLPRPQGQYSLFKKARYIIINGSKTDVLFPFIILYFNLKYLYINIQSRQQTPVGFIYYIILKLLQIYLSSHDKWFGVTYKEDRPIVVERLRRMGENGDYPMPLFS